MDQTPPVRPLRPLQGRIFSPETIRRVGVREPWRGDLYHRMLTVPWWALLSLGVATYVLVNAVFAGLYLLQPGSILGSRPGNVLDAFFFSVETIATIGYGVLSPGTTYANVLMLIETVLGILMVAMATGVLVARVSRPTARVMFARVATIAPWNGVPSLFLRMGNERRSQILEADVALYLLRFETSSEGVSLRRFHKLHLERGHTPAFALSYTAIHRITPDSPLHGATPESLSAEEASLTATVTGLEEATGQTVHARHSYSAADILWGRRYADIFATDEQGERYLDYRRFDETVPA